jgi:hypothetical protein
MAEAAEPNAGSNKDSGLYALGTSTSMAGDLP